MHSQTHASDLNDSGKAIWSSSAQPVLLPSDAGDRWQAARFMSFGIFLATYLAAFVLAEHAYGSSAVPSPFWLPDSVLLSALLLAPRRDWWVLVVATCPVRLLVGATPGTPLWFQLLTTAIDASKAIATAWLLQRSIGRRVRLDTLREFFIFLAIAAVAVPALSAIAVAPWRYILGDSFWGATYRWFIGDALAQVIVTPMILFWCARSFPREVTRVGELLIVLIGIALSSVYTFVLTPANELSLVYVPVPFLLWAAVRLGSFGTANGIALVAIIAMIGAVRGSGMFAGDTTVLALQLFLFMKGVSLLSLSILITERQSFVEREKAFSRRLLNAQEQERARIARDLHDDFGQRLALLQINLEHFGASAPLSSGAHRKMNELSQQSAEIAALLRTLSHKLHPQTLDIVGLDVAIKGLCDEIGRQNGLDIEYSSRNIPPALAPVVSIALFRIVQEALHNVIKHSHATLAAVHASSDGRRLILIVADDGDGFDVNSVPGRTGLGLTSIRERLHSIGGVLSIRSASHLGTRIRVEVPLDGQTEETEVSTRRLIAI
jgi:signal transduction histidine kinase